MFAPPGKAFVLVFANRRAQYLEILSYASTCGSKTEARQDFDQAVRVSQRVHKIGDEAGSVSFKSDNEHSEGVLWRSGQVLGYVFVQGPPHDSRITLTAAESLARQAVSGD